MSVPRAQLRVFAPLASFPPRERERWSAYAAAGGGVTRRELARLEDAAARATSVVGAVPRAAEVALVRRAGEQVLVCPVELDLRAAVAFAAFERTLPPAVAADVLPAATRSRFEHLARSGRQPSILDEAWVVPLPWFLAFAPEERRFTDPPEGSGPRLRYVTTVAQARARLQRAITVVEGAIDDGEDVLAALAGLDAWLDPRDPSSILELDYGQVARQVAPEVLRADRSCEELWDAVEALAESDLLRAAAGYAVARARWSAQRARAHVS
jgi:hypothetical protein